MIGHSLGIVLLRGVRQYGFLRRAATTPLSNEIPVTGVLSGQSVSDDLSQCHSRTREYVRPLWPEVFSYNTRATGAENIAPMSAWSRTGRIVSAQMAFVGFSDENSTSRFRRCSASAIP